MELTECQAPVVWSNKRWHASRPQVVRLMSCIGMRTRPNMLKHIWAVFQPATTSTDQGNISAQKDNHCCSPGQYFSPARRAWLQHGAIFQPRPGHDQDRHCCSPEPVTPLHQARHCFQPTTTDVSGSGFSPPPWHPYSGRKSGACAAADPEASPAARPSALLKLRLMRLRSEEEAATASPSGVNL